ncbi:RNA polymerase sigma-70 factor [Sphingobacterium sp. xlx-130]|uniref:RNA polymerase sigma-70 factor n=1 Tax=Sphingobacterium sp. xlx-130 TaxID=2654323 RepID=UPI0013D9554F|nr:RNA polymerase sigma-70 factor [Sphingobacterium sp. xlx-130]
MSLQKETKFEQVFREHFKALHGYAYKILEDSDAAEEAVQQVFLRFWERDWENTIHTSVKSYLYKSVYYECLNVLKRGQLKQRYEAYQQRSGALDTHIDGTDTELKKQLHVALAKLPEKSRAVFEMSRFQELKYHEIAKVLELSLKTVEGHMTKALRHLRVHLADYLNVVVFLLINGL